MSQPICSLAAPHGTVDNLPHHTPFPLTPTQQRHNELSLFNKLHHCPNSATPQIISRHCPTLANSANMLPSLTIEGKHNRKFIFYIFAAFISFANIKKTHVQFRLTHKRDCLTKRQTLFKTAEYREVFTSWANSSIGRCVCVCVCVCVCCAELIT